MGTISMAVHVGILLSLVLSPIFFPQAVVEPHLVRLFIDAAPPPPPPLKRGEPLTVERPTEVPRPADADEQDGVEQKFDPSRLRWADEIPDEILKPKVALEFGVEDGWDFGDPMGMEGGIPGGVVGGVPGGVIGGVIGGTGTGVPRNLPQPDVGPRPIRRPLPKYTVEAIRKKITGEVVLRALINEKGKVKVLNVVQSIPELDDEAIRVVEEKWLFSPAKKNGRPVACVAELAVTFNLY
jgi:protein TonB